MTLRSGSVLGIVFTIGIVVGGLIATPVRAQLRTGKTQTLLRADLAGFCEGKEVLIELFAAGPGTSGKHYHPGHSFTWVIEGSEVENIEGKPPTTVHAGEVLHEEPMQVHANDNQAPVRVLTFRILEKNKAHTTRVE